MGVKENAEFLRWFNGFVSHNSDPKLSPLERDLVRSGLTRKRLELTPHKGESVKVALREVQRLEQAIEVELEKYSQR